MTYPASIASDEEQFWIAHDRIMAKEWPQVERRKQPRLKVVRTPYHKAEIIPPRVKDSA